ncbi:MAG: response regulator [Gloeomargarita sp. SKYBB_i_bin120]|nr:response regulator [Gloeomargarita sp. SKYG98]MCS7291933.1 response regulator [Gloeomargarita sp. SKYB120]MDW8177493.1 response regulator [Gloeomargarita sp. SKYBB_i_bin120]
MADPPADDILACFRAEAPQLLAELEKGLLNLRRERSAAAYYRLMRVAHSLKGGAASVGMHSIQTLAQRLEEVLQILTVRPETDVDAIEDLLLQGFDCLRLPLAQWLKTGVCDAEPSLRRAEVIYPQLTERLGPKPQAVEPLTSQDLQVDLVQTLLETDIAPKIQEIRGLLSQPHSPLLVGELRAQFDVLAGLGEMLDLTGLTRISRLALAALTHHPEQALTIAEMALRDLEAGGPQAAPSPELVAWSESLGSPTDVERVALKETPIPQEQPALADNGGAPFPVSLWEEIANQPTEFDPTAQGRVAETATSLGEATGLEWSSTADALAPAMSDASTAWASGTPIEPAPATAPAGDVEPMPDTSLSLWEELGRLEFTESQASDTPPPGDQTGAEATADGFWTGPPLPPPTETNADALAFFAQEAQELLQTLETGLLELRQHHDIPHIHALMRAAHSLKGGAATVGWTVVQGIAHRLENALQALYHWPGAVDLSLEEALLRAFDSLRHPLQAQLEGLELDPKTVLQQAEQAFRPLEAMLGATASAPAQTYVPSSQDLGVDMTATIFSGDVQQGLTRLEQWLAQPTPDDLTEVKTQLEVLASIGELLNLAGWRAICQTGLQALAQHPEQATAIVPVIVRDLRQGYAQVMAGERAYGGAVSPELQAFVEPETAPPPVAETPAPTSRSVRVDVERLERLNNLIGELVIQENGALLYQQQLQQLVQRFNQRLHKLETLSRLLQDAADQATLLSPQTGGGQPALDPLQMDTYSPLYSWVQTVIEEVAQVAEIMRDMGLVTQQAQEQWRKKQQTLKHIRSDLLWMRMVPLNDLLQRFPRLIRDLSSQYGKQVRLRLVGANTLVDKAVLEKLSDPLVHLVRNAFDHGIEPPEERRQRGKNPEGTIEIHAYYRGNQTYIVVRDDGRGIDFERVRQKAIEKQLLTPEQAVQATQEELINCLFTPGFSTAPTVSDLSGRGVGLDVVRLQIQALKGTIQVHSEPGQGTTFTLRLPLTLTITKLLVFRLEQQLMALAVDSLAAIVRVPDEAWLTVQGRRLYRWQGRLVPLIPPSVLAYHYPVRWNRATPPAEPLPLGQTLLLLSVGDAVYGLEIDQIVLEQDLVIKPLSGLFPAPPYVYGCTILGDGQLVPVLDATALVQHWLRTPELGVVTPPTPVRTLGQTEILVVDDSLTMRGMLTKTLSKHGYQVYTAADGREALDVLAQHPGIKAVFCDVEMPRMNGFEFLSVCRQQGRYPDLPIIMLTSRAGQTHQQLAKALGCSAYLTKPYLEPELLQTLRQLTG